MENNIYHLIIDPLLNTTDQKVWKQIKKIEIEKIINSDNIDNILDYILIKLQEQSNEWRLEKHFDIFVFRK